MKKIILFTASFILFGNSISFAQDNFIQSNQENNYRKQRPNSENKESRKQFRLKKSEADSMSKEKRQEFKRKKEAIMKKCKKEIEKLRQEYGAKDIKNGERRKHYSSQSRNQKSDHREREYKKRKYQQGKESSDYLKKIDN